MNVIDLLLDVFRRAATGPLPPPEVNFHDRRKHAAQKHHGYPVRSRSLNKVTGVVLHQTACNMGMRPERYDGTGSHVVVTRNRALWLHDWTHRVVAANGWNDGTVSIEINGLYAGVEGDIKTVWDDPSTPIREQPMALSDEAVTTARWVLRWMKATIPNLHVIVAHRQSSGDRRNDPGSEIWGRVAIPAREELGLVTPDDFTLGDGRPIPREWDPRASAKY